MKKKLALFLLPFFVICLTACQLAPFSLERALKKTSQLNSFHVDYEFEIGTFVSGLEITIPIQINMDVDMKNQRSKADFSVTFLGITANMEAYTDFKNNIIYFRKKGEEQWEKREINSLNPHFDISYSKVTLKETTKTNYHYQIIIDKMKLMDLFSSLMSDDYSLEDIEVIEDVKADIFVDKKTKYIQKIQIDITDSLKNDKLQCSSLKLSMTFSDYNKIEMKEFELETNHKWNEF